MRATITAAAVCVVASLLTGDSRPALAGLALGIAALCISAGRWSDKES